LPQRKPGEFRFCKDVDFIREFMCLPEIAQFAEYGCDPEKENYIIDDRSTWVVYIVNGVRIGLISLNVETGAMCTFHPYILAKHKRLYLQMVRGFFLLFDSRMPPHVSKLNTRVAVIFTTTIKWAQRIGMKAEGIDKLSFLTESGPVDRVLLGITREDIKCQAL